MKGCDKQKNCRRNDPFAGNYQKYKNNLIIPKLDLTIYDGEFFNAFFRARLRQTTLLAYDFSSLIRLLPAKVFR